MSSASTVIPSSPDGTQQLELTPRSKVKALLAGIDEDSNAETDLPHHATYMSESTPSVARASKKTNNVTSLRMKDVFDESGEEESDEVPAIPTGKLAGRLHTREQVRNSHDVDSNDESESDVYTRVKKRLLQEAKDESERKALTSPADKGTKSQPPHVISSNRGFIDSPSQTGLPTERVLLPTSCVAPKTATRQFLSSKEASDESDSDLPAEPQISTKLQLLVARKRSELDAKEASRTQKKAKKHASPSRFKITRSIRPESLSADPDIGEDDGDEKARETQLTQHTRPTRKASKKALEEMSRETQRMSRNMQLAHQARTRKKVTKESFLKRFNYQSNTHDVGGSVNPLSSSAVVSSAPGSDLEGTYGQVSPPTSPAGPDDIPPKLSESAGDEVLMPPEKLYITREDVHAVLPSTLVSPNCSLLQLSTDLENPWPQTVSKADVQQKGVDESKIFSPSPVSRLPKRSLKSPILQLGSDSELEIVPHGKPKRSKLDVFNCQPAHSANEKRSLQTLRALANMNSPDKRNLSSKPTMTMSDMQESLRRRARKQAAEERAQKIKELKERGVIIQTVEERERDQAEVEDLVEKARREAAAIMQKEIDIAKKQKLATGNLYETELTSEEDDDYRDNEEDESEIDVSGSEEEQEKNILEEGSDISERLPFHEDNETTPNLEGKSNVNIIQAEVREGNDGKPKQFQTVEKEEEGEDCVLTEIVKPKRHSRRRPHRIIDDDDEEDEELKTDVQQSLEFTDTVIQKPFIPDFAFYNELPMGMTQAFAATMADTQTQGQLSQPLPEQGSSAFSEPLPEPNFPNHKLGETSEPVVPNSQTLLGHLNEVLWDKIQFQAISLNPPQSQAQGHILEHDQDVAATQYSDIPDPTQDAGFILSSPARNRFVSVPPSTVDTVLLSGNVKATVTKKNRRLHRRAKDSPEGSTLPQDVEAGSVVSANAFDVLKKAVEKSFKSADVFDKKRSQAKTMIEEQAQESEDEYAGLGGASDDESIGEVDADVEKMIDEGEVNINESELAAFYA